MIEHLPRHVLEQAPSTWSAATSVHLARCAECSARRVAIEKARATFLERMPPSDVLQAARARAASAPRSAAPRMLTPRRALLAASMLAAAAALLIMLRPAPPAAIRLKGGSGLEVYVQRDARSVPLRNGDVLGAGDRIGFLYSQKKPRHLLLLSIDDTGAITRYFPAQEGPGAAPPLPAGTRALLPIGVELDAHRGQERLLALFADAPLDEARARSALRAAFEAARARNLGLNALPTLELPGVDQESLWFRKP